ncbi:MAG TPA: hypothetical protein VFJ05_02285 [Nitrososphaeraceae archaeon]|nr:hypothetical protein [Nitrososphaeraceae archaeon]
MLRGLTDKEIRDNKEAVETIKDKVSKEFSEKTYGLVSEKVIQSSWPDWLAQYGPISEPE